MVDPSPQAALARAADVLTKGITRFDKALESVDRRHEVNREGGLAEWLSVNILALLRWVGADSEIPQLLNSKSAWVDNSYGQFDRMVQRLSIEFNALRDAVKPMFGDEPKATSTKRPPSGGAGGTLAGVDTPAYLAKAVWYYNRHRALLDVAAVRAAEALHAIRAHQYAQTSRALPALMADSGAADAHDANADALPSSVLWKNAPAGLGAFPRLELKCKYPLEPMRGAEKNGVRLCLFTQVGCESTDEEVEQWEGFSARVSVHVAADAEEAQTELSATIRCLTPGCEVNAIRTSLEGYDDERWDESTVTLTLPPLQPGCQHDFLVLGSVRSVGLVELVVYVGAQPWNRDAHRKLRHALATLCGIEVEHVRFAEVGDVDEDGTATILCAFPDHPKPRAAQASLFALLNSNSSGGGDANHGLPYAVRYFSAAQPTTPDISVSLNCRFQRVSAGGREGDTPSGTPASSQSAGGGGTKRVGFHTTRDVGEILTVEGCLSERWGDQSPRVREEVFRQNLCTILDRVNRGASAAGGGGAGSGAHIAARMIAELCNTLTSPLYDHPLSELRQTPVLRELLWTAMADHADLEDPDERAALIKSLRTQHRVLNASPRDSRPHRRHTLFYTEGSRLEKDVHSACVGLNDELQRMRTYITNTIGSDRAEKELRAAEELARLNICTAESDARAGLRKRHRDERKGLRHGSAGPSAGHGGNTFGRSSTHMHSAGSPGVNANGGTPVRTPRKVGVSPSPSGYKRSMTYDASGDAAHPRGSSTSTKATPRRQPKTGPQPTPRSSTAAATPPRAPGTATSTATKSRRSGSQNPAAATRGYQREASATSAASRTSVRSASSSRVAAGAGAKSARERDAPATPIAGVRGRTTATPRASVGVGARARSTSRSSSARRASASGGHPPQSDLSRSVLSSPHVVARHAQTTGARGRASTTGGGGGRRSGSSTTRDRMDRSGSPQFQRATAFTTVEYQLNAVGYPPEYRPQSRVGGVPHTASGPTHPLTGGVEWLGSVSRSGSRAGSMAGGPRTPRRERERDLERAASATPRTPSRETTPRTAAATTATPRRASVSSSPRTRTRGSVGYLRQASGTPASTPGVPLTPSREAFLAMKKHVRGKRGSAARSSSAGRQPPPPPPPAAELLTPISIAAELQATSTPVVKTVLPPSTPTTAQNPAADRRISQAMSSSPTDYEDGQQGRSVSSTPDQGRPVVNPLGIAPIPFARGSRVCVKCGVQSVRALLHLAGVEWSPARERFVGASGTVAMTDVDAQTVVICFDPSTVATHDPTTLLMSWPVAAVEAELKSPVPSRRVSASISPARRSSSPAPVLEGVDASFDSLERSQYTDGSSAFPLGVGARVQALGALRNLVEALTVAGVATSAPYQPYAGRHGKIVETNHTHFTVRVEFDNDARDAEAKKLWWPLTCVHAETGPAVTRLPFADAPPSVRRSTHTDPIIRRALKLAAVYACPAAAVVVAVASLVEPLLTPATPSFTHWPYHEFRAGHERAGPLTVSQLHMRAVGQMAGRKTQKHAGEAVPMFANGREAGKAAGGGDEFPPRLELSSREDSLATMSDLFARRRGDLEQSSMTNLKAQQQKEGYKAEPERVVEKKHSSLNSHVLFQRQRAASLTDAAAMETAMQGNERQQEGQSPKGILRSRTPDGSSEAGTSPRRVTISEPADIEDLRAERRNKRRATYSPTTDPPMLMPKCASPSRNASSSPSPSDEDDRSALMSSAPVSKRPPAMAAQRMRLSPQTQVLPRPFPQRNGYKSPFAPDSDEEKRPGDDSDDDITESPKGMLR